MIQIAKVSLACASCQAALTPGRDYIHACAACASTQCDDCFLTCADCGATVCAAHTAWPYLDREDGVEVESLICVRCAEARREGLVEMAFRAALRVA